MTGMKEYYVYMVTTKLNSALYTGVTSALETRNCQHKSKTFKGFTAKYNIQKLVHFEIFSDPVSAITREKQIKGWTRAKKNALISKNNPGWRDLSHEWEGDSSLRSE
jgi:putative endonuclease